MGKASRWFRALLGLKKPDPKSCTDPKPPAKKKWSFGRPHTEKERRGSQHNTVAPSDFDDGEASRHAAAVAAATAAVAEAAVAAAQAAAAVVQLTSSAAGVASCSAALASRSCGGYGTRDEWAAVRIQSHFRAYLARRALQALKGLVKLQALAKGYICRKQFTEYLQQMQAIARAQERARAGRVLNSEVSQSSTNSSSLNNYNSPATPEKSENIAKSMKHRHLKTIKRNVSRKSDGSTGSNHRRGLKLNEQPLEQGSFTRIFPTEDEKGDKILEVDTVEPNVLLIPNYRHVSNSNLSDHPPYYYYSGHLRSPNEAQSFGQYTYSHDQMDETSYFCTGQNSPSYHLTSSIGGSSKRAGLSPAKSNGPKSYLSGYLDHPNYMANTESSKAKVRSVSAPKQRPVQYERSSSASRNSAMHELGNNNSSNYNCDYNESRVNGVQRALALHASFTSKAYPGSGRLDRLGMPVSRFFGLQW